MAQFQMSNDGAATGDTTSGWPGDPSRQISELTATNWSEKAT